MERKIIDYITYICYTAIIIISIFLVQDFLIIIVPLYITLVLYPKEAYILKLTQLISVSILFIIGLFASNVIYAPTMINIIIGDIFIFSLFGLQYYQIAYFLACVGIILVYYIVKKDLIVIIGLYSFTVIFLLFFIPITQIQFYFYVILLFNLFSIISWLIYANIIIGTRIIKYLIEENKYLQVEI